MTMTARLKEYLTWWAARTIVLAAVFCCTACESVFDEEGDCTPRYFVRFVYDMNMLRADAFSTQVESVDLYVFDAESGTYIAHFADKGEALASGSYKMPVELAPGKYDLVAWCGLADNDDDFTVPSVIAKPADLVCTMARSHDGTAAYSNRHLHALYHGTVTVDLPDAEGEHTATVRLTKDTNNINLSLQHAAGPLDPDDFEVTLTDNNGLMAYDNSLLADEQITYYPWSQSSGKLDLQGEMAGNSEKGFLMAELSTARLMANHEVRVNIVDKQKGKTVFSIPVVQWALMLRSANHASMGEQEYLDREDEYSLMVFLDDDNKDGWTAMSIYINGWHVINMGSIGL